MKLALSLINLVETTLFDVQKSIKQMSNMSQILKSPIKCLIYQAVKLLNVIVSECCVRPVLSSSDHQAENFIKICCDLVENKRLISYYERNFGLLEQLNKVYESSSDQM